VYINVHDQSSGGGREPLLLLSVNPSSADCWSRQSNGLQVAAKEVGVEAGGCLRGLIGWVWAVGSK
jgi:hypothetical protein